MAERLLDGIRMFGGAVAIVTGGASGIGLAIAGELAKRGCEVVLADCRMGNAEKAAEGIRASGGKAKAAEIDVASYPSMERLVLDTVSRTGRLDFMFNNAGIAIAGTMDRLSIEDWRKTIDVNLLGVINGTKAAYPVMTEQGFGHIVNTSSAVALMAVPGITAYSSTKYAVYGFSRGLRGEAAEKGIRVSVLCPGTVRTPILDGVINDGSGNAGSHREESRKRERHEPMSASVFARKTLDLVAKNEAVIVMPYLFRLAWYIDRFSPSLGMRLGVRTYRERKQNLAG